MLLAQLLQVGADQMAEQLDLHVGHQLVADPVGQHRLDQLGQAPQHADPGDGQGDDHQGPRVGMQEQPAHRRFEQPGQQARQGAHQGGAGQGHGQARPMRRQIGVEHPRHQPAVRAGAWFGGGHRSWFDPLGAQVSSLPSRRAHDGAAIGGV